MQDFDDPADDRCRYCGLSLRFCDCGSTCMNGHSHKNETEAIICELDGPDRIARRATDG